MAEPSPNKELALAIAGENLRVDTAFLVVALFAVPGYLKARGFFF